MTNSETDVRVVTQEDDIVVMAVIRLITATVQHCETQKSIKDSKSAKAEHIKSVAAASVQEEDHQHSSTWHDCI